MNYLVGHTRNTGEALDPRSGSGKRLWQLSQMRLSRYRAAFARVAVIDQPQFMAGDHAIVLGRETLRALKIKGYKTWLMFASKVNPMTGVRTTLIPHPLDRNQLYNEIMVRRRIKEILAEASRGTA